MNYFVFSYAETVLTESVALVSTAPIGFIAPLALPTAASSGAAVAGVPFFNAFDATNGNYFTYDAKKICYISNNDAVDSVDVTFKTVNTVENGLDVVREDLVVRIGPKGMCILGNLPPIFNDATKVKISIAEVAGTAITDCKIAVVKNS